MRHIGEQHAFDGPAEGFISRNEPFRYRQRDVIVFRAFEDQGGRQRRLSAAFQDKLRVAFAHRIFVTEVARTTSLNVRHRRRAHRGSGHANPAPASR